MHKLILIIFSFLLFQGPIFAQKKTSKNQLAYQYYRDKAYDKAGVLYKELYDKGHSTAYLKYWVKCLIEEEEYSLAEKTLKKEIKGKKNIPSLKVQLGSVYLAWGQEDKAKKLYRKSIEQLKSGGRHQVISLANAFISQREYTYAEATYLKGRKLSKGEYSFAMELANVYYYSRNYQKMINEFMDVLDESETYLKTIQNRLQATVYKQDDGSLNDLLKRALITRIQKSKDQTIYSELLIWLYLQEKEFGKAFIQTKALDKRNQEDGNRLIALGELAYNNKDYKTAVKCYDYVLTLGEESINYLHAKVGSLVSNQAEVLIAPEPDQVQIQELLSRYESLLSEIGNRPESIDITISYAYMLSFYAGEVEKSILILEDLLDNRVLNHVQQSAVKMELADELLLNNDIWEATLYFSQVIKANPNNEIGNEAQIKKAKLSYYSGDFLWAKGQLDVLKASTSKLISNDALYLSSVISDNLQDTIELPLQMFSRADLLIFQKHPEQALLVLDSLQAQFSGHSLTDDILYKKAEIFETLGKDTLAKPLYQEILDKHYSDILADNALMALANLYVKEDNPEKAMELYTQLLVDFPDSFFTTDARRKIVEFRDS